MLRLDPHGMCMNPRILPARRVAIERGKLSSVSGIIVHQTGASTAQSSLNSYQGASANGAHFLIDHDGTIYQTASLSQKTWHVGKLKARCLVKKTCPPAELAQLKRYNPKGENEREQLKSVPDRYPSNDDSIGIELVGATVKGAKPGEQVYETVTDAQNAALKWLVQMLASTLQVPMQEVFRHPDVSRKNPTEAQSARW